MGRRATRGLTLLEVLAAVVVVGITYGTFFRAGGDMLQREGENKRRIEASLLADRRLAEIEAEADRGLVPSEELTEEQEGIFDIEVEVVPALIELTAHERGTPFGGSAPDPNSLLGSPARPGSSTLRRIDVRVRWTEGYAEREIERTTFAFDPAGAQAVLQSLLDAALGGAAGDGGEEIEPEPGEPR